MNHDTVMSHQAPPAPVHRRWRPVFVAAVVAPLMSAALWGAFAAPPEVGPNTDTVEVERVIDGDTIEMHDGGGTTRLVRYLGIDAPEIRRRRADGHWTYDPRPYAEEALALNRRLVEGKRVSLTYDKERHDKYGRLLAYVYVNGRLVNAELVERGLARVMPIAPNTRMAGLLLKLQREARAHRRGIWADSKTTAGMSPGSRR